jgi:hypothetical protein
MPRMLTLVDRFTKESLDIDIYVAQILKRRRSCSGSEQHRSDQLQTFDIQNR